jgi:hypothetical protein
MKIRIVNYGTHIRILDMDRFNSKNAMDAIIMPEVFIKWLAPCSIEELPRDPGLYVLRFEGYESAPFDFRFLTNTKLPAAQIKVRMMKVKADMGDWFNNMFRYADHAEVEL